MGIIHGLNQRCPACDAFNGGYAKEELQPGGSPALRVCGVQVAKVDRERGILVLLHLTRKERARLERAGIHLKCWSETYGFWTIDYGEDCITEMF